MQPCVRHVPSFVVIQHPQGYTTEHIGWFLNRQELLDEAADCGLTLDREFLFYTYSGDHSYVDNAPEDFQYLGFLFRCVREPAERGILGTGL